MFTAVRCVKSKSTLPALLHLQQHKPYMFMDPSSYNNFSIRPGKMYEYSIPYLVVELALALTVENV